MDNGLGKATAVPKGRTMYMTDTQEILVDLNEYHPHKIVSQIISLRQSARDDTAHLAKQ